MLNLGIIKQQFQTVEDNLGIAIDNLNDYQSYMNKQLAENLLSSLATWYENSTPTENVIYKLDIAIETIQTSLSLLRIQLAFISAGKTFTLYCIGGNI
jgi:hypothetical protein